MYKYKKLKFVKYVFRNYLLINNSYLGVTKDPQSTFLKVWNKVSNFAPETRNEYIRSEYMKAVLINHCCQASDLKVSEIDIPKAVSGWV